MRKLMSLAQLSVIGVMVSLEASAQVPEIVPQPVTMQVEGAAVPPPPASQPPPAARKGVPITASYDGGTILRSDDGKFEMKLTGRFQARYDMRRVTGAADDSEILQRFVLPRTRIGMEGFVFTRSVTYKLEGSFSDAGIPRLRDFYANVALMGDKLQLRFGQFKRPFNRQEIVSDFATELPEKALTNDFAEGSRDIGLALHDGYDRSPDGLEWVVGIFNGSGDRTIYPATTTCTAGTCTTTIGTPTNAPADFQPQLIARLGVNVGGIKGYSEGDLEGGPLRFAAAINYRLKNLDNGPMTHAAVVDAVLKVMGFSLQAAGLVQKVEDVADATFAAHVQAGYFVTPRAAQVDARFAIVPLPLAAMGEQQYRMEVRGGFNYYWFGHNLKLSSDVGVLDDTTEGSNAELQVRVQGQLVF